MFRNYLLTALRNIWKNKTYSFLNIFGLAVGVACAGLIFLWVEAELNYDPFPKKEVIYNVRTNQTYNGMKRTFGSSPGLLAAAMKADIPGVVRTCRTRYSKALFSVDDKSVYETGMYADSTLCGMFSMSFLEGGVSTALRDVNGVAVSEKVARQFFGSVNGVAGRTIRVNNKETFTVSSVFRDFPLNSTVRPDFVISFATFEKDNTWLQSWGVNGLSTFVELSPTASLAKVNQQLKDFIKLKSGGQAGAEPLLIGMKDWRLRDEFVDGKQSGGRIQYVRLFVYIACIILLIACINFMNLATARSEKRAREVGVRKVLGAERGRLIGQFIGEAMLLSALSVALGVLLIGLVLPAFNLLVKEQLSAGIGQPLHIFVLLAITVVCGLVAGSYPALYLSGFNPIHVLKRLKTKEGGAERTRRVLVVAQFSISIFLILSTVIVYRQVQHIKSRNLGYNKDNLLDVRASPALVNDYDAVRQDLLQTSFVESTGLCDMESLDVSNNSSGYSWPGKDPKVDVVISIRNINHDYIRAMGMQLVDGRDFRSGDPAQDSGKVLITEALAKMMGGGSAVGKYLKSNTGQDQVVGVVKDYIYGDFYGRPDPVVFYSHPSTVGYFYIRVRSGAQPEKALAAIGAELKKDNPGYPFDYSWVDDKFNSKFLAESLIGKLSGLFAALAIFISCLGLFGLAAYTAEQRTREIGIRKVLGASVSGIAGLLSRDFLKLVIVSNVVALPLAALVLSRWLEGYAYRISLSWWMFAAAAVVSVLIALATVGFQAVRAAVASPVKSLRAE